MQLAIVGLNHQTAPLAIREQVALNESELAQALQHARSHLAGNKEVAILSTCNRTELYFFGKHTDASQAALTWLAQYRHIPLGTLQSHTYHYIGNAAVARHVFRVASGLDSMVLGETQITGQLKQAVAIAQEQGTLGTMLHHLFQSSFTAAKTVRSQTDIGSHSISLAAAAVRLAQGIFPSIAELNILFIGAGEMIELCLAHFVTHKPKRITIANRSAERAQALGQRFHANCISLAEVSEQIAQYDVVISCTASSLPILGKGLVERAIKQRKHRPILLVDLAVPRDIEAEVSSLDDVFLYSIDQLAGIVQTGMENRQIASRAAESLIDRQVQTFVQWCESRITVPIIRSLHDHAERIRRHELEKALKALQKGEPTAFILERLSQTLTNKLLHAPTHTLQHADPSSRDALCNAMTRLYQLETDL